MRSSLGNVCLLVLTFAIGSVLFFVFTGCKGGESSRASRLSEDLAGQAEVHEALLAFVPQEADLVVALPPLGTLMSMAYEFALEEERISALVEEMQSYTRQEAGFFLSELGPAVFWAHRQDGSWGVVAQSRFEGTLAGPHVVDLSGRPAMDLGQGTFFALGDGVLLIGSGNGLEAMNDTSEGRREAMVGSTNPIGELLQVRANTSWLRAAAGADWISGFVPPMSEGLVGASLHLEGRRANLRVRFGDPNQAAQLLSMAQSGVVQMIQMMEAQSRPQMELPFPVPLTSIVYRHLLQGQLVDRLSFSTDGSDLLATVILPDMDPGSAVFLSGVGSAIAIPAFLSYVSRSKTTEAAMSLRRIYDSAISYYDSDYADSTGNILPRQFPASTPLTPSRIPCGERAAPQPELWQHPTWQALGFSLADPHYYSYRFESSGVGPNATFTASAFGDLDCDGEFSTFMRVGEVTAGGWVSGGAGLYQMDELE
ncbi:MAG: hypothetical protein JW797_19840 [Bradymonadales bacterium]|nr:hypothetical protein [Bradymonadales bacterium]